MRTLIEERGKGVRVVWCERWPGLLWRRRVVREYGSRRDALLVVADGYLRAAKRKGAGGRGRRRRWARQVASRLER